MRRGEPLEQPGRLEPRAVRGCSGRIAGRGQRLEQRDEALEARRVVDVAGAVGGDEQELPGPTPCASSTSVRAAARGPSSSATSTITSPTTSTRPATRSARRFSAARSDEHSSSADA